MQKIYLLRHGKSVQDGTYVGSTDCDLCEEGQFQLIKIKKTLASIAFDATFSSPLKRCKQTLSIIEKDMACITVGELREIDFGLWEGRSFEKLVSSSPELVQEWADNPLSFRFPEGECISEFISRVTHFGKFLVEKNRNIEGNTLVVCHGGVIRFLLCELLGLPLTDYCKFNPLPGRLSIITVFPEGSVLEGFNLE